MAEPTEYDLVQDDILSRHDAVLTGAPLDLSGDEVSFPVEGKAMGANEWAWVTRGMGNGVLDMGGWPYRLAGFSNTTDTATLGVSTITGTGNALVNGFYHQLNDAKTIPLPPVSQTTTYHICLTYNPVGMDQAGGPVTVQTYAGTPPTTQGKIHVVLYTVTRTPNQLLTDATVKRIVTRVSPQILVWDPAELPEANNVLWGTQALAHRTRETYLAVGNTENGKPTDWQNVTPDWIKALSPSGAAAYDTGWVNVTLRSGFTAQDGITPQVRRVGKRVDWRWGISNAGLTTNSATTFADVPAGFRPTSISAYGYADSNNPAGGGQIYVAPSGAVTLHVGATLGSYYVASLSWYVD
ncbi:MAG: hypothetical protein ACTH9H_13420 [Galactobacter sp.]